MKFLKKIGVIVVVIALILAGINYLKDKYVELKAMSYMMEMSGENMDEKYNMKSFYADNMGQEISFRAGVEKETGKEKYILVLKYDEVTTVVYADEGTSLEETEKILRHNGHELTSHPRMRIRNSFDLEKNDIDEIKYFMYWDGFTTENESVEVNFFDGKFKVNRD